MSEMVERVARALFAKRMESAAGHPKLQQYAWEEENQPYREFVLSEARAVIEAMREPTGAMIDVGVLALMADLGDPDGGPSALTPWWAMIDAALNASPTPEDQASYAVRTDNRE